MPMTTRYKFIDILHYLFRLGIFSNNTVLFIIYKKILLVCSLSRKIYKHQACSGNSFHSMFYHSIYFSKVVFKEQIRNNEIFQYIIRWENLTYIYILRKLLLHFSGNSTFHIFTSSYPCIGEKAFF